MLESLTPLISNAPGLASTLASVYNDSGWDRSVVNGMIVQWDVAPPGREQDYPDDWQAGRPYWILPGQEETIDPTPLPVSAEEFLGGIAVKTGAAVAAFSTGAMETTAAVGKAVGGSILSGVTDGLKADPKFWAGVAVLGVVSLLVVVWVVKRI